MSKTKRSKLMQGLAVFMMLMTLVGCAARIAYKEIMNDPIVMDFEIYKVNDVVTCTVILETDAKLENPALKADQFRETVRQIFNESMIIIEFMQNDEVIFVY